MRTTLFQLFFCVILIVGGWTLCSAEQPVLSPQTAPLNPRVKINYDPSDQFSGLREHLQRERVLEKAAVLLAPLRLPVDLTLRLTECRSRTRTYDAAARIVTICYEVADYVEHLAQKLKPEDRKSMTKGAFIQEALHQLAIGIIAELNIPVWGRQEDAADQLAAFVMVDFDQHAARVSALGSAQLMLLAAREWSGTDFAVTYSPEVQRAVNFLCIAFGSDQLAFDWLVRTPLLPLSRARQCRGEFVQLRNAFDLRVMPFVDPDLLIRVRALEWLSDASP